MEWSAGPKGRGHRDLEFVEKEGRRKLGTL